MKITKSENVVFCDVDDTLVMHMHPSDMGKYETVRVYDLIERKFITLGINEPMIRLLKEEYSRGSHIKVWSRGGYAWAANIIKELQLESYVHEVLSKPTAYFDDKPIEEWLKYRVYISPDAVYKNKG
jgi:hypothetical protein